MTAYWHGTNNGYVNKDCRCPGCRSAHRAYLLAYKASRRAMLADNFDALEHGRLSTYTQAGCRCDACVKANRVRYRKWRLQQRAAS